MTAKGLVRILLSALVIAVFFSACGQNLGSIMGTTGSISKTTGSISKTTGAVTETTGTVPGTTENGNVSPITFNFYINFGWWINTEWGKDLATKEITKLTGVTLNIDKPSNNEESVSRLNTMLMTGDYPDMVMMPAGVLSRKLIQKGMFIPLNDLLDKYGTDIKRNVGTDYLKEFCTEGDGKLYGLPDGMCFDQQNPQSGEGILLLKSVYERLGSPPLDTVDDLHNYLLRVKQSAMKNKDGEAIIPSMFDWPTQDLAGPFGVRFISVDGGSYAYGSDNILRQVMRVPEMKEIFHYTSMLFREKLIDQEWFTQDGATLNQRFLSGRYAVDFATNAFGVMDEYGDKMKKTSGDSYILIKEPLKPGVVDPKYNLVNRRPWTMVYITSKCKDPKKAMEFLNWEASEKGQYITRIGPEGVVWKAGAEGKPELTPEFSKKAAADKEAALAEIGYMRWCFMQNTKYVDNALAPFMSPVDREERAQRARIIIKSMWFAPELEKFYIDPASGPGIANMKINSYFGKMDRKMYMAEDDETFESLYQETIPEMEKMGLKELEAELNRQIKAALSGTN